MLFTPDRMMNEKIKELAEQASLALFNDTAQHRLLKGFAEKFAELIVKECAAMTRNLSPHGELAEKAVKEYFGVK
jgi:hypothetical protein